MQFNIEFLKFFIIFCLTNMVNKCVVFGCSSGYHTNREKVSTFSFPLDFLKKFVNSNDWFPLKNWWKNYSETKVKQTELGFTSNSYNPFRKLKKTISSADDNRIKKASETPIIFHHIVWYFLAIHSSYLIFSATPLGLYIVLTVKAPQGCIQSLFPWELCIC